MNTNDHFSVRPEMRHVILSEAFAPEFMSRVAAGDPSAIAAYCDDVERIDKLLSPENAMRVAAKGLDVANAVFAGVAIAVDAAAAHARSVSEMLYKNELRNGGFTAREKLRAEKLDAVKIERATRIAKGHPHCEYDFITSRWMSPPVLVRSGRVLPHVHDAATIFAAGVV